MTPQEKQACTRFIKAMDDIIDRKLKGVADKATFCQKMNMQRAAVAQIRTYQANITPNKAITLGKTFGISMNWLFLDHGPMYLDKANWKKDIERTIKKLESLL